MNMNLQIKRDPNGVPLTIEVQDIENINVQGFFPVILDVKSVNFLLLLGFDTNAGNPVNIGSYPDQEPVRQEDAVIQSSYLDQKSIFKPAEESGQISLNEYSGLRLFSD